MVNRLTSAFTGGTKKQGAAGEILLINILQQSGLREGKDFEVQKKFDDEVNGELKRKYPDIILHLPDSREIIIDSKVSLSAWQEYCNSEDQLIKEDAHKRHVQSIRSHLKKLSEANYQKIYEIKTLDAVIMFMPYESAFDSMLDKTEEIILEANKYKIILASPSTLISVLKIIDNMWSINERNKNADLIAGTALEIYSQVEKVYSAFENAGYELSKSMGSIETAKSRLRDGKGSFLFHLLIYSLQFQLIPLIYSVHIQHFQKHCIPFQPENKFQELLKFILRLKRYTVLLKMLDMN